MTALPQKSLSPRATLDLMLLALLWGGSFLAIRTAVEEVPVATAVAWRVVPAAVILGLVARLRGRRLPRGARVWGAFLVMGILNNVIPFLLISWAQLHIETGLAAILNASAALFAALAAALLLRDERLTRARALGLALGFGGVLAAVGPAALAGFDLRSAAQIAMLGATLGYALAGVWARLALPELPPEVAATGMLTGAGAVAVPLALLLDGPPDLTLAPATWAGLAYTAAVSTALAYLLYWRLMAAAGSANTMFVTLMIPPVAIALGALVRGEVLPANAFLGLGLLALGLIVLDGRLAARFARRRPPAW